jgi:molybdopterin biosynthesis enzyme
MQCNPGTYPVVGRVTAGVDPDTQGVSVARGTVAYITTGSKLPQGADAVRTLCVHLGGVV